MSEADENFSVQGLPGYVTDGPIEGYLNEADDIWELIYTASRLDEIAAQTITTLEPATTAKYAFTLAQRFNLFYHRYKIISEADAARRFFYLSVVNVVQHALIKTLDMMGIQVPRRM
jgi:arginyl-tRNA synthetase